MEQKFIDHFYVVEDLQVRGALNLQTYPTLKEAIAAYRELPADKLKALGAQNTMPLPGSLDLVQCQEGKNVLILDYSKIKDWDNREIRSAREALKAELGAQEPKQCRFIDAGYNKLFLVPSGERIILNKPDGSRTPAICENLDEYHTRIGNNVFHICEFAERCQKLGITYAPEHPRPADCLDTYEIYQLHSTRDCDYAWRGYDVAKEKIRALDYHKVYTGVLAEKTTPGELFALHNRDTRPMAQQIRSMSISDVVVLRRGGKATAHYVDDVDFAEIPGFAQKLDKMQERQSRAAKGHGER